MTYDPWTLSGSGNCYEAAVHLAMELTSGPRGLRAEPDHFHIVHGLVTGTAGEAEGLRYGHAWIEVGASVLDASKGEVQCIPKGLYYRVGQIDPAETYRYTWDEARRELVRTETYGPWHTVEDAIDENYWNNVETYDRVHGITDEEA